MAFVPPQNCCLFFALISVTSLFFQLHVGGISLLFGELSEATEVLFAQTHLFWVLGYASSEPFTVGGETFAFVYNPSGGGCNGRVAHHGITVRFGSVLHCYTSAAKDECKPGVCYSPG